MADEEPPGPSGVGLEVEQSARSYGGAAWALQNFGDDWDTSSVTGRVIGYYQGRSIGFDRYIVERSSGEVERMKWRQILPLLRPPTGK